MKKITFLSVVFFFVCVIGRAQDFEWVKQIAVTNLEKPTSIAVDDSGFI